jgi:hypothetical protein
MKKTGITNLGNQLIKLIFRWCKIADCRIVPQMLISRMYYEKVEGRGVAMESIHVARYRREKKMCLNHGLILSAIVWP